MYNMFRNATLFNGDISKWDTSAVSDMYAMFYQATTFDQNIGSWNTTKVTAMRFMFYQATTFNQDLSGRCVQTRFDAEPDGFKVDANNSWANDAAKQPDWDSTSYP